MKDEVMLAKWLNNELDEKELKDFMATPEFDTYNKIKEYSAQLTVPEADMDALYNRIENGRIKPVKVKKLTPWITRIAAMLVIALGASYFLYINKTTTQLAENGRRTEFLLPDNSSVMLNAGSEVDYKTWNWENNRKLQLNGEAYFKVAKGQTFDVVTSMGKVTVVGTQFNVKARDNRFDVTCFEGKVRVTCNGKTVLLTPGKSITFENGKMMQMQVEQNHQPGWLTYEVAYNNEKLTSIISEIERQYNVSIELNIQNPEELTGYTGYIRMNNLNEALESITTAYQLKSQNTDNKIILSIE